MRSFITTLLMTVIVVLMTFTNIEQNVGTAENNVQVAFASLRGPISKIVKESEDQDTVVYNESNRPYIETWKGGRDGMDPFSFAVTVAAVIEKLPFIPNDSNLIKLALETAAIESDNGQLVTESRGGRGRGVYQFHMSTVRYIEKQYFKENPDIAEYVHQFLDRRHSLEWNIKYNIPYQTAMMLTYYHLRVGDQLDDRIQNRVERFKVYKKYFNTPRGASTAKTYVKKADLYIKYSMFKDRTQPLFI